MIFDYGSKLEAKTGSSFDGLVDWQSMTPERRMNELVEWARTNTYLHLQLVSAGTILATELVLNLLPGGGDPDAARYDPTFFRPLSPQLELSTLFLWAFLEPTTTTINVFGVFPVQPLYFPIIMSLTSGIQSWRHMVQGFVAAVVAAKVFQLKRPYTNEDVTDWIGAEVQSWRRWMTEGESRQVRRGGRVVPTSSVGEQQPAVPGGRGGYLSSAPAVVTQQPASTFSVPLPEATAGVNVTEWLSAMLPPARRDGAARSVGPAEEHLGAGQRLND
ncbi:hypothetical protein HDU93_006132 [Gonapodya sp. JEL0774]|nr:hypothetical protein HDU93_006132 [Gonapodya sp. JEL0774]